MRRSLSFGPKLAHEGGFSSKLRIECLIELSHEARTHRPSPSSNTHKANLYIITQNSHEKRKVVTRRIHNYEHFEPNLALPNINTTITLT
uniref:Bm13240 n=1 Tax=Brugia malayi TaxID=6279 RepID=A0A1I9FZP7_BRUMA|nr:Bm13240 [Brugia malayi]